jgi:hypothetical protein
MKATFVNDVITPLPELEALLATRDAYRALVGEPPKTITLAILVAQCALETGRWKSCHNHNWGNVKAGAAYVGYYTAFRCNELLRDNDGVSRYHWYEPRGEVTRYGGEVIGATHEIPPGHPQTRFRAHRTAAEGCAAHLRFLWGARYVNARAAAQDGDVDAFCRALKQAGYFTAPLDGYLAAVSSLTRSFTRAIEQHDVLRQPTAIAPVWPSEPEPERSPMTGFDLEDRSRFLVADGMARLGVDYWENVHNAARDAAVREG